MATIKTRRCLVKVREVLSPYHQEFRGYRIMVATPNWAGRKPFTNEPAPSFDKPYLIVQFGDYEDTDSLAAAKSRVDAELDRRGFENITWIEKE